MSRFDITLSQDTDINETSNSNSLPIVTNQSIKLPIVVVIIGMAGTGKTSLLHR